MLLTIRENHLTETVEFLWNDDRASSDGKNSIFQKSINDCESFWRAWESLVFREGIQPLSKSSLSELERKSQWLTGVCGFSQDLARKECKEILIIQSDTKWLSLPWELLYFTKDGLISKVSKRNRIQRQFLAPDFRLHQKICNQAFFLFQAEFGGELKLSLEREFQFLKTLNWKELKPEFYKNGLARIERLKEILPSSRIFYLAGHLTRDKWTLPDGSELKRSDLESLNLSGLELVFLNACYSAFGLAQSFLSSGAREVVGFSTAVPNEISEEISKIFWSEWTRSHSSEKAYTKARNHLKDSIFQYSWMVFGGVRKSRMVFGKSWLYGITVFLLLGLLSFGAVIYWKYISNNFSPESILVHKEKTTLMEEPIHPNPKKSKTHPQKNEQKSKIVKSLSQEKKILTDSKNIPIEKKYSPTSHEISDRKVDEFGDDLGKRLDKLSPDFAIKIQDYLNDNTEILSKEKRILLVGRILEMDRSTEWKQEVFRRETGR